MRKFIKVVLIVLMTLGFTACSKKDNNEQGTKTEENSESVAVDKKILNVDITLPKFLFDFNDEEIDYDEIIDEAKEDGAKDVRVNEDGSITYTISKSKHKEVMDEMKEDINEYIDELIEDEDFVSFKSINPNKNFSKIDIVVDKDSYENSFEGFAVFGIGFQAMFYQLYDGAPSEKLKVEMNLIDVSTNEVFDTIIYPDAFDE